MDRITLPLTLCVLLCCTNTSAQTIKSVALFKQVSDCYKPPSMNIGDPEKYYWPKAMARMELYGQADSLANSYIDSLSSRSPFHFTLLGMARLLNRYPAAPAIVANREQILRLVFEREDGLNAFTGEGTENHVGMSRTSGYLFAEEAAKNPDAYPQAKAQMEQMKNWLMVWAKELYAHGSGEWNSSIYAPYNFMGWLNLFDFAQDTEVRDIARAVLDFYAAEMALHNSWGTLGGAEMRGNGISKKGNASDYYLWYWFAPKNDSIEWKGSQYIQLMHGATSEYIPPKAIQLLAHKPSRKGLWWRGSKPSYLFKQPAFIDQYFYATPEYTLGSAAHQYAGFTGASTQIVDWKMVVKAKEIHSITGNGLFYERWTGQGHQPFTQVGQHKNMFFQFTKQPQKVGSLVTEAQAEIEPWQQKWLADYKSRFPVEADRAETPINFADKLLIENSSYLNLPDASLVTSLASKLFKINLGEVVILVTAFGQKIDLLEKKEGHEHRKFLVSSAPNGRLCGFVLEVLQESEWEQLQAESAELPNARLKKERKVEYRSIAGSTMQITFGHKGSYSVPIFDWGFGPKTAGSLLHQMPFDQPSWPSGKGRGRIASWQASNEFSSNPESFAPKAVYEGPGFRVANYILSVEWEGESYKVDFTDKLPTFSSFQK